MIDCSFTLFVEKVLRNVLDSKSWVMETDSFVPILSLKASSPNDWLTILSKRRIWIFESL